MKSKIFNILSSPFFLSFLISLTIIFFIPPVFDKYKAELLEKTKTDENKKYCYHDFDNDGFSEKILFIYKAYGGSSFEIFKKGKVIDQWNFPAYFAKTDYYMFSDYDNNGFDEIYLITYKNDSVFLNCIEPLNKNRTIFTHKFISKYRMINNIVDFGVWKVGVRNLNNDCFKEIVFAIMTALSLQPRNLFAYDIANDTVYKSPKSGSNFNNFIFFDINNDGFAEIINVANNAFGNFNKPFPYTDHHCWLMVFNRQLNFLFEPVKIGQYPSVLCTTPFKPENKTYLAVFYKYSGTLDIPCSLMLYDNKGNLIKKRDFESYEHLVKANLISKNKKQRNKLFFIYDNGLIEQLDSNLNVINTTKIEEISDGLPFVIDDFDNDGEDEFLFWGKDHQKLILTRNDFSDPVVLDVPNNQRYYDYSIILNGKEKPDFFLQFGDCTYLFQYYKNPLYYFKYLFYFGIYAIILLLIIMLNKTQKHRIEQRYKNEKKIVELQMKSIKNQTDPHFTLNIINSISSLYQKRDIKRANYVFGKYAKMLRYTLLSSDNILVNLSHELDYVENYLLLEKFRLDNKFDFNIDIEKDIDTDFKIPKMLIHTFVENAIKHGLKHLKTKGKINISINRNTNNYLIYIIDNGIGRENAKKLSTFSTHRGLKILDQILELHYKLLKTKIDYEIIDLYDNSNNPKGTKVVITIPVLTT